MNCEKWISRDLSVVETFTFFQNFDTPAFEQSSCIHNHHVLTTGWFFPNFYASRYLSWYYMSWVEGKELLYWCFQIFVAYLFLEYPIANLLLSSNLSFHQSIVKLCFFDFKKLMLNSMQDLKSWVDLLKNYWDFILWSNFDTGHLL